MKIRVLDNMGSDTVKVGDIVDAAVDQTGRATFYDKNDLAWMLVPLQYEIVNGETQTSIAQDFRLTMSKLLKKLQIDF